MCFKAILYATEPWLKNIYDDNPLSPKQFPLMKMLNYNFIFYPTVMLLFIISAAFKPGEGLNKIPVNSEPAICWDEQRKLDWSDFKATRKPTGKIAAAISTCGFGFEATEENHRLVSLEVFVKFYPEKSWKNPAHQTEAVLAHEQLHFDITELMGRKFFQEILDMKQKGKLSRRNIKKVYERIEKEHGELQVLYDKQTNHSLNTKLQSWWDQYLASQLIKTASFSNYHKLPI
ncbi:MAG: hypothetical protein COW63_14095 [Bacteroidetes bacterium CG18_big_fil_WC_8_21_14_2_50_41_14]|nr:MAG: hypothetical protein COW63_14095 [Bacteroidetes bacterium CG18_big_fil_WC_8_21_14_2_50_41_14]